MKLLLSSVCSLGLLLASTHAIFQPDPQALVGHWEIDLTPENGLDDPTAIMIVKKVSDKSFSGTFYREGVKIREGRINTQRGIVYGALVSGDNSGDYNTSFYLKDGVLYGSTHAIDRGFLSVWTAVKKSDQP
ncbi:hypothetical protein [Pontibacter sp. G13]|uniref:hypothetical protein n=1 Tax=Pontibacter sp. G13 TaxID=3074898 RepID=UPI002889D4D5|nr:hypothetical protein [Pontibacter sp. G13]WNJ18394.1 hypothetical protein RJD25_26365 [Pontibacter sp. G13]